MVLGYSNNDMYLKDNIFLGAFIGRIAGRISNSSFVLNNKTVKLEANEKTNLLHGGKNGLHTHFFKVEKINDIECRLSTIIKEIDDNIFGDINLQIKIELIKNKINITYTATSTEDTILNLTNHTYWNLNLNKNDSVLNHNLNFEKTQYLELDDNSIPTGKLIKIEKKNSIKDLFENNNFVNGIDNFFQTKDGNISISNDEIEILMSTSEPGYVVYTGNNIKNLQLSQNILLQKFSGICLEDQNYQDSINNKLSNWELNKNIEYKKQTSWTFNWK